MIIATIGSVPKGIPIHVIACFNIGIKVFIIKGSCPEHICNSVLVMNIIANKENERDINYG